MEGFPQNIPRTEKLKKENKIEKPQAKEGVNFVFEQHSELAEIGTKEQYSEYLDTIFPESEIKDIVYHQTTSKEFDATDWKLSRLGGAYFNFYNSQVTNPKLIQGMINLFGKERTIKAVVDVRTPFIINKENYKEIEKKIGLSTQDISKLRNNFDLSENDSVLGFANPDQDQGQIDDFKNHSIPKDKKSTIELALFDPSSQIHVLGSKSDIEKFKDFIEKNNIASDPHTLD
jgi:hypothetical protein